MQTDNGTRFHVGYQEVCQLVGIKATPVRRGYIAVNDFLPGCAPDEKGFQLRYVVVGRAEECRSLADVLFQDIVSLAYLAHGFCSSDLYIGRMVVTMVGNVAPVFMSIDNFC